MPLESTPEMNMPTMTIMTSYPDASPDEVDEMVTQKIESALSGITEVESMTSTSSEGSSMIMLEFGCDVDTDDKYQDITSALAMVQLPEDCSDPTVMQMDSSSMNSSILNISISTTDAANAVAYVEDNIVPEIERIEGVADVEMVEQERTSYSCQNGEENISISVAKEQDGNTVSICNQVEELVNEFNADSSLGLTLEIISNSGEDIYDNAHRRSGHCRPGTGVLLRRVEELLHCRRHHAHFGAGSPDPHGGL